MTIIDHKNKVLTHLTAAIDEFEEYIQIEAGDYASVLGSSGDLYLIILGPVDREMIKVKPAESVWGIHLKVERGQGGSQATEWPSGSRIFASTTAEAYNSFIQKAENRLIDYNPNLVLTPLYAGEKVFQPSDGYTRWWKAYNGIDPYWDLITGVEGYGENYTDIGWNYDLLIQTSRQWLFDSSDDDGHVGIASVTWSVAQGAGSGSFLDDTSVTAQADAGLQISYDVRRIFYFFDLTGMNITTITSAKLSIFHQDQPFLDTSLILQKTVGQPPLTLNHFGGMYGEDVISDDIVSWASSGQKDFDFNADGITFIEDTIDTIPSKILCVTLREYYHDYLDIAPANLAFYWAYAHTNEATNPALRPQIEIIGS